MRRLLFLLPAAALLGACVPPPASGFQESGAAWLPDRVAPTYPWLMAAANVEGEVMLRFVVDERGAVEPESVSIRKSSHESFSNAARSALLRWRATPAKRDGRPVRQVAFHRFAFRIRFGSCSEEASLGADSTRVCAVGQSSPVRCDRCGKPVAYPWSPRPLRGARATVSPSRLRIAFPRVPLESLGCGEVETSPERGTVRRYHFLVTTSFPDRRDSDSHFMQTGVLAYLPAGVAITPARLDSALRVSTLTVNEAGGEPPMTMAVTRPTFATARYDGVRVVMEIAGERAVGAFLAAKRDSVSLGWCEREDFLAYVDVPLLNER